MICKLIVSETAGTLVIPLKYCIQCLVEARPVDAIWGIGMAKTDENICNLQQWKGENLPGFALMEVRDDLTAGQ